MMGADGGKVQCTQWVHWFEARARVGDRCMCGQRTKEKRVKPAKSGKCKKK